MPVGSPGFVGSRLREAREARQVTAANLASLIDVSAAGVSLYEHGRSSPRPDVLSRIATTLNFKLDFFFRPVDVLPEHTVFERSRAAITKSTRRRARHHRAWLREIVQYLDNLVFLPKPNLPSGADKEWIRLSQADIEATARLARRHWSLGDGPISDMTLLMEKNGVIVAAISMNANSLDAFSTWDPIDQRPYIVLGTDIPSAFRARFNVSHELGHLILHKDVTPREFNDQSIFKLIEAQADRFAAAFLTPSSTFSEEIAEPSLELFRVRKPRWRTSIKMMIHRAQDLDIIDRDEARRFYINYNRRGWNRKEPLDDETQLEHPRLLRKVFEAIVEGSVIERSQIVAALPFNREDIEQLCGLPYGYLDEDSAYNQIIRELGAGFT